VGRDLYINLACFPWPVNVLKFYQVVHKLQTGDKIIARINDAAVVGNLQQFFSSQPDLHFEVSHTDTDYRIRVTKR
jgi:TusA-related sulfurtransferase